MTARVFGLLVFAALLIAAQGHVAFVAQEAKAADSDPSPAAENDDPLAGSPKRVADEAEWDGQWKSFVVRTAAKHVELAGRFIEKADVARAVRQYRWALSLDPNHEAARTGIGYEKRDGAWVEGKFMLRPPLLPAPNTLTDEELARRLEAQARLDRICDPIVGAANEHAAASARAALGLHQIAKARSLGDRAKRAIELAAAYAPLSELISKERGFKLHEGDWLHDESHKRVLAAAKLIETMAVGRPVREDDPQAKAIGVVFHRRADDTCSVSARTSVSAARAQRLLKVGNATVAHAQKLLGTEGKSAFDSGAFLITEVKNREQYAAWLDKFDKHSPLQAAANKRSTSCFTVEPPGCISIHFGPAEGDDAAANNVAVQVLADHRKGVIVAPWVRDGFAYLITSELLGTTMLKRYQVESGGRTRDWSRDLKRTPKGNPYGPTEFRRLALEMRRLGEDIPISELAVTTTNRMTERHIAKSIALIEFLFAQHGDATRKWLAEKHRTAEADLKGLLLALEMDEAALEAALAAWSVERY